jgi:hypothetical protein
MEANLSTDTEKLKSLLNEFKNAFDAPEEYLQSFFNDVREKIEYESRLRLEMQKNNPFFLVYNKMLNTNKEKIFNKITSFEKECMINLEQLRTDETFWKRICYFIVFNKFQIENYHEDKFKELSLLIEDSFDEFRKSLFLNKTLCFLNTVSINKSQYSLPKNENYFGRLAFANIFLSRKVRMELFK